MTVEVDITTLATPLDGDAPSGPDLEYDADFMALERAVASRGERVVGGDDAEPDEPDWERLVPSALDLFARTRDLRVAAILSLAWLRTGGLPGWRDGLALIDAMLGQLWESVHPQLDADDDDDPTARVNALMPLADPQAVLRHLRSTPFVRSARLGAFSLRDLRIANGEIKAAAPAEGEAALPTLAEIEACCLDCDEAQLAGAAASMATALDHAKAIDRIFTERVGSAGPELKPLLTDTYDLKKFLDQQVARRSPQGEEAGEGGEAAAGDGGSAGGNAGNGRINGPQDVIRRIDELCAYYDRSEPSSPVPLLLRRAQRLVGKNFADLLKDLAPGGMSELQNISGVSDSE